MSVSDAAGLLACPRCGDELLLTAPAAACPRGHSFDVARQGYLNLLGGPQPHHADTPAMVAARGRVLASGAFDGVAEAVAEALVGSQEVLEVGAGTGWYLGRALGAFPEATGVALDISTAAAKMAARVPRVAAIVADVWHPLPLLSGSVDAVLCVFAPRNGAEFRRVLRPSGRLVVVTPNPGHLATVRGRYGLLDIDPSKDERLAATLTGFVQTTQVRTTSCTDADADLVRDVIGMGPNAFHTEVNATPGSLDIDVTVRTFRAEPSA